MHARTYLRKCAGLDPISERRNGVVQLQENNCRPDIKGRNLRLYGMIYFRAICECLSVFNLVWFWLIACRDACWKWWLVIWVNWSQAQVGPGVRPGCRGTSWRLSGCSLQAASLHACRNSRTWTKSTTHNKIATPSWTWSCASVHPVSEHCQA